MSGVSKRCSVFPQALGPLSHLTGLTVRLIAPASVIRSSSLDPSSVQKIQRPCQLPWTLVSTRDTPNSHSRTLWIMNLVFSQSTRQNRSCLEDTEKMEPYFLFLCRLENQKASGNSLRRKRKGQRSSVTGTQAFFRRRQSLFSEGCGRERRQ